MIPLPKPLPTLDFYILLALARGPLHNYGIKNEVEMLSLRSLQPTTATIHHAISKLEQQVLIELGDPSSPRGNRRTHYALSRYGHIRLQEEYQRLTYAVALAKHAGITEPLPRRQ